MCSLYPAFPNGNLLFYYSTLSNPGNQHEYNAQNLFRFHQFYNHAFECVHRFIQFDYICSLVLTTTFKMQNCSITTGLPFATSWLVLLFFNKSFIHIYGFYIKYHIFSMLKNNSKHISYYLVQYWAGLEKHAYYCLKSA